MPCPSPISPKSIYSQVQQMLTALPCTAAQNSKCPKGDLLQRTQSRIPPPEGHRCHENNTTNSIQRNWAQGKRIKKKKLGIVVHTYDPSTGKAEAEGSWVPTTNWQKVRGRWEPGTVCKQQGQADPERIGMKDSRAAHLGAVTQRQSEHMQHTQNESVVLGHQGKPTSCTATQQTVSSPKLSDLLYQALFTVP
jgi:hypothetical protein